MRKYGLVFICRNRFVKREKYHIYLKVDELIKMILNEELFKSPNVKACNTFNSQEVILKKLEKEDKKLQKVILKKFKSNTNYIDIRYKSFKEIMINIPELKDKKKNHLMNIKKNVYRIINADIYYLILKALINEKRNLFKKKQINPNLAQTISFGQFNLFKKEKNEKCKILPFIEFHSKTQISNDKNKKNIFISINSNSYIAIFSFNFKNIQKPLKNKEFYIIINIKKVNLYLPRSIKRLDQCYNYSNNTNKNYFLISLPYKNQAIIINISNDYKSIETVETIKYSKGLMYSIELKHYDKYYLIDCSDHFYLWYYDNAKMKLENKKIYPENKKKIMNNNEIYRILHYLETKNIFIILKTLSKQFLEFYKIDEKSEEFKIIFLKSIKTNICLSNFFNNSCVINDKYLIIGIDREYEMKKDKGYLYIISLDTFEIINLI